MDSKNIAYLLLGIAIALLIASFTGMGGGLFGWGWMMGMMGFWMLLPVLVVVLVVVLVLQQQEKDKGDQSKGPQ